MLIRLALAGAVLAGPAPSVFAADCPLPSHRPTVEIAIDDGTVAYDFTRTRRQLAELPPEMGVIAPHHGGQPLGLTLDKLAIDASADLNYHEAGHGSRCVYPEHIKLTLSSSQRVYVDRRYPPGSCERRAVLDHEMQHVRINRAAAHAYESALRSGIERLLAAHPYYLAPSTRPLRETYLAPIRDLTEPILAMIRAEADRQHAKLDSPASYASTHAQCSHW